MKAIFSIISILIFSSCSVKPDGKDKFGYYVYQDSCIQGHVQVFTTVISTGKSVIPVTNSVYICDKSILTKSYLPTSKVKK